MTANSNKTKVLGCGSPIVDILIKVEEDFLKTVHGEKGGMLLTDISEINSIIKQANTKQTIVTGGAAANTIMTLSKLGIKTGFLGKLGKDSNGKFYKESYQKAGGDINQFKYSENLPTAICLSIVTPDSERTMRTYLGAAASITADEITPKDFEGYSHFNVEGYMLHNREVITKTLKLAKEANLKIVLDLGSFEIVRDNMDILPDLIKNYVDIVFCNEKEAKEYAGSDDKETIFNAFKYCEVVALKLGKKGSLVKVGNIIVKGYAEPVKTIDTTGAGDIWQAGFLYGYLSSEKLTAKKLQKAVDYASVLGTEVVQTIGASIPEEKWPAIMERIKIIKNQIGR